MQQLYQVKQRKSVHILQNTAYVQIKPIKPIHVIQNAATVPKKPKKPIHQESWGEGPRFRPPAPRLLRNCFFWFFWYSCSVLHYMDWFYWFYWYSCSVLQYVNRFSLFHLGKTVACAVSHCFTCVKLWFVLLPVCLLQQNLMRLWQAL